jgi:signal peptidase II
MTKLLPKNLFQNIAIALVIAIFFIADRWLKALALNSHLSRPGELIGHILTFNFVPNYYMAFSLPIGGQTLNVAVLAVVLALLVYILYLIRRGQAQRREIILLIIILCGALSNIWDRLAYGYVIDYLDLKYFTVFNLADVMISGGALVLILENLRRK